MNQQLASVGCNDYAQKMPAPNGGMLAGITTAPQKPSMGAKLSKVAEIFELDIINEEEALKACKVIIGQHAKKQGHTEDSVKIVK